MRRFPSLCETAALFAVMAACARAAVVFRVNLPALGDRSHATSAARQWVMYEAREAGATAPQIRRAMGIRHLTTVEYGLRKEAARRSEKAPA